MPKILEPPGTRVILCQFKKDALHCPEHFGMQGSCFVQVDMPGKDPGDSFP